MKHNDHVELPENAVGIGEECQINPKFQQAKKGMFMGRNNLRPNSFPFSGYTVINRNASAWSGSASVS